MGGSSIMDALFQRTLDDLIKGLRLCLSGGETSFISKSMDEIRREIKSTDLDTKSTALQKLSYLSSLHSHDMSFASFHVVELISSTRFSHKRIAYQSASQSFHESTPVIVLITHQLRKDLSSKNGYEVSLALECLSRIGTLDLCRDLSPEVFTLLGSSKPLVKRKAIAVTLRVFEKYPDSARVCFKRLVDSLDSTDAGVLSAAVGVFSELAARDPASYLPLAPEFFRVLVDCKNNWVLIKVLKIFARLAPLEPRLANRVVDPICDLMSRSGAKSVTFECVRTLLSSFPGHEPAVRLAVAKVRDFLLEDDPNLKYLGLNALSMAAPSHPWAAAENRETVTRSLSDPDPNVKLESLRLVMSMVSESNVAEISRVLISHAARADPIFCNDILGSVLSACSRDVYGIVADFDWYVSLLGEMARVPHCRKGDEIGRQLVDVGTRVRDARPELVRAGRELLIDPALLGNAFLRGVLSAAAWASGEYVELSRDPSELVEALVQPRTSLLPPSARAVYLHSALKALAFSSSDETGGPQPSLLDKVESAMGPLLASHDVEVLERSRNLLSFVELIRRGDPLSKEIVEVMEDAFSDELGPVSATAQERVSLPDGLVLNENLNDLDSLLPEIQIPSSSRDETVGTLERENESEPLSESTSLLAEHRKRHGLYYLPSEKNGSSSNDYPPANDAQPPIDGDDLVKLTEESLVSKKRTSHAKPRPAVVRLDGDNMVITSAKTQPKDDSLSEAVREALLGGDSEPDSLRNKPSRGKEKLNVDSRVSKGDRGDPSSREGKSRRQRGSSKVGDENGEEAKKKSGGRDRQAKHRSRKRTEVVPQGQVIPDFLL